MIYKAITIAAQNFYRIQINLMSIDDKPGVSMMNRSFINQSKGITTAGQRAAITSALYLGLAPVFGKLAIRLGLPPLFVVASRTALAALLLFLFMLIWNRKFLYIYPGRLVKWHRFLTVLQCFRENRRQPWTSDI